MKLGVNIDHIATVREARKTFEPDPAAAVSLCEKAGADGIVCHLRKDRRHIRDEDLSAIKNKVTTGLNLEMSVDPEIVDIALGTKPDQATIVPENRQEITTEGGLDVKANFKRVREVTETLIRGGIEVSLFIDPEKEQVEAAEAAGCQIVEFHTGLYANLFAEAKDIDASLDELSSAVDLAVKKGLTPCAGHGLTYGNVGNIVSIEGIFELNIGHSIISRAVFGGIEEAVRKMKELMS